MNYRIIRVPIVYIVLSMLYYLIAKINSEVTSEDLSTRAEKIVHSFEQLFYWINVHVIYIFSVMGTSLTGMAWTYYRKKLHLSRGFLIVFGLSLAGFLTIIVLSLFN